MNHSITSLLRPWLAARAAALIARWQRRISARLQAGDDYARQAGWTITRTRFGGRIYRDPRFDQLAAARARHIPPGGPACRGAARRQQQSPDGYPAPAGRQRPGPHRGTGTEEP
jgi:hypothetical protein